LGHYSPLTTRNYLSELRYLFVYYADVDPADFTSGYAYGVFIIPVTNASVQQGKVQDVGAKHFFLFQACFKEGICNTNGYLSA
jgi:hypothetical protein